MKITKIEDDDSLLIAIYSVLSTGVNIRRLHNLVLASPLKSYTTISQSIGRLVRLHESKTEANIYDIVDDLGTRTFAGPFWKQYQERLHKSYNPENIPVVERVLKLT
jgi:superfamily II DNA or RNA helicase